MRLVLLLLGAATGLVLALLGLVEKWSFSGSSLPGHLIARVGELGISEDRYLQLLNDLAADKRAPLTESDRKFALDRLIDEELLILRGIELGLAESSPAVRKAIAAAVIAQVAAEAEAEVPSEAELRNLYGSDPGFFATTGRYRLRWWRFPGTGEESRETAYRTYEWLRTGQPSDVELLSAGLHQEHLLPDQSLPLAKISDYLGPTLAMRVPELAPGSYSHPIEAGDSLHILHLLERQEGQTPPFVEIRHLVESEYIRRAGQQALSDYLLWLRKRTKVTLHPDLAQ